MKAYLFIPGQEWFWQGMREYRCLFFGSAIDRETGEKVLFVGFARDIEFDRDKFAKIVSDNMPELKRCGVIHY